MPCNLSTGAPPSTTVKVLAQDQYGNSAGPGTPGSDVSNTAISVTIKNGSTGGTLLGTASTANGVASFGDQMKILATGNTKLYASTTAGSAPNKLSSTFAIVNDLEACTNNKCRNVAPNTLSNKQSAYGQVAPTTNCRSAVRTRSR